MNLSFIMQIYAVTNDPEKKNKKNVVFLIQAIEHDNFSINFLSICLFGWGMPAMEKMCHTLQVTFLDFQWCVELVFATTPIYRKQCHNSQHHSSASDLYELTTPFWKPF